MTVTTRLTEKEYINACFTILRSGGMIKMFTGLVLFIMLMNTISGKINSLLTALVAVLIIGVLFTAGLYMAFKNAYRKNTGVSENLSYTFEGNQLIIAGESFKTELALAKIKKVTKTGKWILVWHNNFVANPIPKTAFNDATLAALKQILITNGVKNNL